MSDSSNIILRESALEDGMAVCRLVASSPPLDSNSLYCHWLQCSHFAKTSVAAKSKIWRLLGFISGYLIPSRSDTLFISQVAVAKDVRGQGLVKNAYVYSQ